MRLSLLFSLLALGACAEAGKTGIGVHTDDGGVTHPDATGQNIDAFVDRIDAPPGMQTKTLDENSNDTLTAATAIACGNGTETQPNSYFRVFDPSTFGITTAFHITQVTFQVEDCESAQGNGQVGTVKVGVYTGAIGGGTIASGTLQTPLAQNASVQIPEVDETGAGTTGATVNAPITAMIPAGSKLYAELDVASGVSGSFFYIGANKSPETAPGYFSTTSTCNPPGATPTSMATVAGAASSILMTVTGTY